jgi:L-ascorbate metabolism protein UlaG (beta-lactamase superfamily)
MTTNRTWREILGIVALAAFLGGSGPAGGAGRARAVPPYGPNGPLTLTYVANMGVLASSGETKVLIDALFDKPNPDCRAPAPGTLEAIFKGEPPFDGVDLVLVTHNHPDHFDASLGVRYLETFAGATLVAPADAVEAMRRAAADWAKIGPRVVPIDLKVGDADSRDLKGIPVTACRTLHSGDLESPMNLMYLVDLAGRRLWHEGDTNGKPEVFRAFGLGQDPIDLAIVHYWFPLEPNCSRFLQEVLKADHIALGHLPIRLEDDAPSKIDLVRRYYKDIFLLRPGMPAKVLQEKAIPTPDRFFGQAPPGGEPEKFWPDVLSVERCPHGQLAFLPDGTGVFWSAILPPGPEQTILCSAFDGTKFAGPVVAAFAAAKGTGGPAFSVDGRRLFFNTDLPPESGSSAARTAIGYVERTASGWTRPVLIEATVDDGMTKGQVSAARSGNIYFSGRVLTERAPGIWMCRFVDGRYGPPEKLAGPIATVPFLIDPWVDPDERFLLVSGPPADGSSARPDIGICARRADGSWSAPVPLGPAVNSPAFERFPSLSRDGRFLFFIRSSSPQFVGDQAFFYWVDARSLAELKPGAVK